MSRIAVVGAGVVGVATAWLLLRAGHQVTLIDRFKRAAEGVSEANGAQLSFAYSDALASPAIRKKLPAILLDTDPAFQIRAQLDIEYWIWGLRFLRESTSSRFEANTRYLLSMAIKSRDILAELMSHVELNFDYVSSGKMILHEKDADVMAGRSIRELKASMGLAQELLSREEATRIEPALEMYPDPISCVVYSPHDAAGRPDLFCRALVDVMRNQYGLDTNFGHEVNRLICNRGKVTGLEIDGLGCKSFDQVILATGGALDLLSPWQRPWGALWPVQGYSLTGRACLKAMRVSITDLKRKIVFARVGDEVRAAGLADIGRMKYRFDPARFATFRQAAVDAFGASFEHGADVDLTPWTGGRPCTPSSKPIIRAGPVSGLYLNLGHGTLGWTLCFGSAQELLEMMQLR
ncbi:MAG: FAD-dependent oxidoreductase [Burkholderiales bacterium]|nr:MAG: FAD-dependent oxidoreductase [Burkholderiales bacterium]